MPEREKIYKWTCPICGKTLKTLYEKQLDYWIYVHNVKHQKRESVG
jgi:glutaredoxin